MNKDGDLRGISRRGRVDCRDSGGMKARRFISVPQCGGRDCPLSPKCTVPAAGRAISGQKLAAAGAITQSRGARHQRPRPHPLRLLRPDAIDRVRALRPGRSLQRRQADRKVRRRQVAGTAARARQLPEGEVVQRPRPVQGRCTERTAGFDPRRLQTGTGTAPQHRHQHRRHHSGDFSLVDRSMASLRTRCQPGLTRPLVLKL